MSDQAVQSEEPKEPELNFLVLYKGQLESYKKQREQAKSHLEQLNGVIFGYEQIIFQHEESYKKSLKPNEDQGVIDDGKTKRKRKK